MTSDFAQQWQEIVTTALLGTGRRAVTSPTIDSGPDTGAGARDSDADALTGVLASLPPREPESALLARAAVLALYREAGTLATIDASPAAEPCALDDLARCSGRAGQHLAAMLGGQFAPLMGEWLAAAASARLRVPEELLPALLELGRTNTSFQEPIRHVLGTRGIWLAEKNPAWSYVGAAEQSEQNPEALWQTGDKQARSMVLARLRMANPARARELVREVWTEENADTRAMFVRHFEHGLGMEDEPFLEAALDDKSKQVREAAAELLRRLPGSRLVGRMCARATQLLKMVGQKNLLRQSSYKLSVTLPETLDKEAIRDGIHETAKAGKGEKASWLLEIIERVPPSTWSRTWSLRPEQVIGAAQGSEWSDTILQGWLSATKTFGDVEWAEAMLVRGPVQLKNFDAVGMLDVLPPEKRASWIMAKLNSNRDALLKREITPRILWALPTPWTVDQSRTVLRAVKEYLAATVQNGDWEMRGSIIYFARALSPAFLDQGITIMSGDSTDAEKSFYSEALDKFATIAQFRKQMLEELR